MTTKHNCKSILMLFVLLLSINGKAQNTDIEDYNRSSIYTLYMLHLGTEMYEQIHLTCWNLSSPEKYNNHDLSLKILMAPDSKTDDKEVVKILNDFLKKNQIAKRIVSKWFNRDKKDGSFNISLVQERGNYNATEYDLAQALMTIRGKAMLADAGEQLIGNTFVIINDISYVNNEDNAQKIAIAFQLLKTVGETVGGDNGDLVKNISNVGTSVSNMMAGFKVNVKSYLFQLKWDDEVADTFYQDYYYDKSTLNNEKKREYEADKDLFQLKYIGSYSAESKKTVMRGLHNAESLFSKVLTRAIDKNIVELQKKYDVFKVTASVISVDDDKVKVQIGLKEGISENSKYEVLEKVEDTEGNISYKRVGIIKPMKNLIWDNRYMAVEEKADGANLNYTTFEIVSGNGIYPGMLIREIKYLGAN